MFSTTTDLYDELYSFKDYAGEVARIRSLIAARHAGASSILDVACGTGEHARLLSTDFEVDGVDLEPQFIEIARTKNPRGAFRVGDMRSFQMGKKYDVVQCLFSAIGYMLTPADIAPHPAEFPRAFCPRRNCAG